MNELDVKSRKIKLFFLNLLHFLKSLDESLKEITANILRQLNESSHQLSMSHLNTSTPSVNAVPGPQPQTQQQSGPNPTSNSESSSDTKVNQLVLLINTT